MQTIQGYLATLIIEIYGVDTLTFFTAYNHAKGRNVRDYVAKTKAFSAEVVKSTTDIGSQIFGGMGYMEEQDTTLYLRRGRRARPGSTRRYAPRGSRSGRSAPGCQETCGQGREGSPCAGV